MYATLPTLIAAVAAAQPQDNPDVDITITQTRVQLEDPNDGIQARDLLVKSNDDHLVTPMGVAVLVGGGAVGQLTDRQANATDPGGTWLLRGAVGTRSVLAAEVAYIGGVQPIDQRLAFEEDAGLLSNGAEVDLRVQVPIVAGRGEDLLMTPFLAGGFGFLAHDVVRTDDPLTNDGTVGDDVTLHIPVALGLGAASDGWIGDVRLTYRPAINDASVFGRPSRFDSSLDGLALTASVGFEI